MKTTAAAMPNAIADQHRIAIEQPCRDRKLTAPRIEPSEIHFVSTTDRMNSANAMANTRQSKTRA